MKITNLIPIIYIITIVFSTSIVLSQEKKLATTASKRNVIAKEKKIEVNSKTQTIYIIGGIASTITKEDLAFAKKYNIQYHDFGCLAPTNFEEYEVKNALVFEKLNSEFGKNWQKEIKSSAMGFEKWRKN